MQNQSKILTALVFVSPNSDIDILKLPANFAVCLKFCLGLLAVEFQTKMGKIGGVQTLSNCFNLSSFPPQPQRLFYAAHELFFSSTASFSCSHHLACASFVDRKFRTKR